jgi:homoserine kinase type II
MDVVYVLHHIREDDKYAEDAKLIGVYRSEESARAAISRLAGVPGFREYPAGFSFERYKLDMDHWCEGFVRSN